MSDEIVAEGITNTNNGSVVVVKIDDIVCHLSIKENSFGDSLPTIPTASRVEHGKILYELKIIAKIKTHDSGEPVTDHLLTIRSDRPCDAIKTTGKSDSNGEIIITLQTRESGKLELSTVTDGVTLLPLKVSLQDAWYESKFLITGYNVCAEADFAGPLVIANGLAEKHLDGFLFGARGVPMQGTGKTTDGRYIRLKSMTCGWHLNAAQHRDRVSDPGCVSFEYSSTVLGKYNVITENSSIAIDPHVIPPKSHVEIDGVGRRSADDRGSAINDYHIDNFLGFGNAVVNAWLHGGINGKCQRVKYIGVMP